MPFARLARLPHAAARRSIAVARCPGRYRSAAVALATACLLLWTPPKAQADNETLETAVKAAYLTKLGDFVEWPPGTMPADAFHLCVIGASMFGDLLDRATAGQTIQGHAIRLSRITSTSDSSACQMLFVAGSSSQEVVRILSSVQGVPVLTVTDQQPDIQSRGIVNFVIRDGRVRFEIDRPAAAANHLVISSKLLDLAVRAQE